MPNCGVFSRILFIDSEANLLKIPLLILSPLPAMAVRPDSSLDNRILEALAKENGVTPNEPLQQGEHTPPLAEGSEHAQISLSDAGDNAPNKPSLESKSGGISPSMKYLRDLYRSLFRSPGAGQTVVPFRRTVVQ